MASHQASPPEGSRNSIDRRRDQSASTNSQDETLIDASPGRTDEVVAAEKQAVDVVDTRKKPLSGLQFVVVVTAVTLTGVIVLMDMTVLVTAIPEITTVFNSLDDIGWYANAYTITMAVLLPLAGKLTSHYNSKLIFMIFLFLFTLGNAICGAAQSSTMLIIGRAVAGLGGSGLINSALTIVSAASPVEKRPIMYGIVMGFAQVGVALGPIVGGALTEHATWRWCFYMNLPICGAVAAAMIFIQVPDESVPLEGSLTHALLYKMDLIGFSILAPSSIMFLLALAYGGVDHPWDSATVIGLFCGGGVGFILFFIWEERVGTDGMFPSILLRRRIVWASCVSQMMFFGAILVGSFFLSIYFQSVKGESPLGAGVNVLPVTLVQVFSVLVSGALTQRLGYYLPFPIAGGLFFAIGFGLLSTLDRSSTKAQWVGYQIIVGLGRGLPMQSGLLAVQANVGPSLMAVGTAMILFSQQFGGALVIAIARALLSQKLRDELKDRIPGVDAQAVVDAGARGDWKALVGEGDIPEVIASYTVAVGDTFYLGAACGVAVFVVSFGMGWVDLRKVNAAAAPETDREAVAVGETKA